MNKYEIKYHYMSDVTGEIHENIFGVLNAVYKALKHRFPTNQPASIYIKYIFLWRYSKQGF